MLLEPKTSALKEFHRPTRLTAGACGAQDAGTYDEASRTGGANGSVAYELDRPENFGLNRGFRPIEKVGRSPTHAFSLTCLSHGW